MKNFSAGIIGLGYWGPNVLRNIIDIDNFKDIYCYDIGQSKLDKNKKRFPSIKLVKRYDDILNNNDINCVFI